MSFQPGQIPVGRVVGGTWRVVRPLGRSTPQSALFVVEQQSTGRTCALRVLDPALVAKSEDRERFEELCRLRASVRSLHVVDLLDAGVDERMKAPWFAMPFLEGPTLAERVARGPLADEDALDALAQVASGLSAIHAASAAYGCLDPSAVILVEGDHAGGAFTARVLDFWTHTWLRENGIKGRTAAVAWMAPELVEGDAPATPAADVWTFGLLAFFALTGRSYWRSAADGDRLKRADIEAEVGSGTLVAASERARELGAPHPLPDGFDAWFSRCVDRDPAARFEAVQAAMEALDDLWDEGGDEEGEDEEEREEADVIRARPRPPVEAPARAPFAGATGMVAALQRALRSSDIVVPVALVAVLGGALAVRAKVMRGRAQLPAAAPTAPAAAANPDQPTFTPAVTDTVVGQLVEALGAGRGSPVWIAAMADDPFSVAQAERLMDVFRRAGWDVKPLRRTSMRLRPGYFLFAAEEEPPSYVDTVVSALNGAGLAPAYNRGYRAFTEEMRRTRPEFRGFAFEEGQSFLLVVGRGPTPAQ